MRGRCSPRRRAPPPWRCRSSLWLVAAGALDDFAVQVLGQAGDTVSRGALSGAELSWVVGGTEVEGLHFLLAVPAGGLWVAGLLGAAIAVQDARMRPAAVAALLWIVVAWLRVKLASYEFAHQYYPALPGIAVGLALGVAALWQPSAARRAALAAVVLVVAAWPYVIAQQWNALDTPPWERPGVAYPAAEQYPVGRFVAAHTRPSDPHRRVGPLDPGLLGRRAPGPDALLRPRGQQPPEGWIAERRRDLFARPPRAIVLMPRDRLEPDLVALMARVPYRLAYDLRGARVWLRS